MLQFKQEEPIARATWLCKLIIFNSYKRVVEIGASAGDNARNILRGLDGKFDGYKLDKFTLVDLPEHLKDPRYQFRNEALLNADYKRIDYIAKPSLEAVKEFTDESLDLVFIDGDHTEEAFVPDIEAWLPKLRVGGILCGDEYLAPEGHSCHYRTEKLNQIFTKINHLPEERLSEGKRTYLWWIIK